MQWRNVSSGRRVSQDAGPPNPATADPIDSFSSVPSQFIWMRYQFIRDLRSVLHAIQSIHLSIADQRDPSSSTVSNLLGKATASSDPILAISAHHYSGCSYIASTVIQ